MFAIIDLIGFTIDLLCSPRFCISVILGLGAALLALAVIDSGIWSIVIVALLTTLGIFVGLRWESKAKKQAAEQGSDGQA